MGKSLVLTRVLLISLVVLVWAGVADADWVALCDFGKGCDGVTRLGDDGKYYTDPTFRATYDIVDSADGSDTDADICTALSYNDPNGSSNGCDRCKSCGTDGTWATTAQNDGNSWQGGHRADRDYPCFNTTPWTYELYITGLDDTKVYDFTFYANAPLGCINNQTGVSGYTINGTSVWLPHTDNFSPSNTLSITGVAPYDYDQTIGWTDEGDHWAPVTQQQHGVMIELANWSIINVLEIAEVPEPATLVMLGLGGLAVLRRRKR